MGKNWLEYIMALHAAPMLKGIKPGSLLSFPKNKFEDFKRLLNSYKTCFLCKGITICPMIESERYISVFFFRKKLLEIALEDSLALKILKDAGYGENWDLDLKLALLKERMKKGPFPHEIGLFLGYPPQDVLGFIKHKGHDFLISGYWKVYENEDEMRKLFEDYASCTKEMCQKLAKGVDFSELLAG